MFSCSGAGKLGHEGFHSERGGRAGAHHGAITIDGDYLRVAFAPEDRNCKTQIEARDKRLAVEDACEQVLGRRLTLLATISGPQDARINPQSTTEHTKSEAAFANPVSSERVGAESSGSVEIPAKHSAQGKEKKKDSAVDDPKLRALVEKFHGEVIEVIKPEQ